MLNRKFASIRASAQIDKRSSVAHSHNNQRMSQSQSMEMQSNYQRTQNINNNVLMNLSKEALNRSKMSSPLDRRFDYDASPATTPVRSPLMKSTSQHPYVNLMHQQQQAYNIPPYQLQYQNNASIVNQPSSDSINQSWNPPSTAQQPIPLVTHYTAAQIYMRPKVIAPVYPEQNSPAYSTNSKKPPPPEVPKRLSSTISTGSLSSLKKTNGLSRSSQYFVIKKIRTIFKVVTFF